MGFVTYALEESGVAGRVGFYDPVVDGVCWFVTYARMLRNTVASVHVHFAREEISDVNGARPSGFGGSSRL